MLAVKYKNKIGKSRYDDLFEEFGVNNPNSYAYNQYKIYIKTI